MKKKITLTIICAVLSCVCLIGTTFAWLTDKTTTITNTFTVGNIEITLEETKGTGDATSRSFKMIPGATIDKDPKVTVKSGSEACWLFVKIEETNNTFGTGDPLPKFVTYTVADGWTLVPGQTNVYYRQVGTLNSTLASNTSYSVLEGDVITINSAATATDLNAATGDNAPKLAFTAYAIQLSGFESDVAGAWTQVSN